MPYRGTTLVHTPWAEAPPNDRNGVTAGKSQSEQISSDRDVDLSHVSISSPPGIDLQSVEVARAPYRPMCVSNYVEFRTSIVHALLAILGERCKGRALARA